MYRATKLGSLFSLLSFVVFLSASAALGASLAPDPEIDSGLSGESGKETAVLAGGCFWCTEAVFEKVKGVKKVTSGYAGGKASTADYRLVAAGKTNHAESIEIVYDPSKITYGQILKVFFSVAHDPTQLNRQGPDYGRQYRSAIFWLDEEQKRIAKSYIQQLEQAQVFSKPIVTELNKLDKFYAAEPYHQDYVVRNPMDRYVVVNALPKIRKLKKQLPELVK